MNIEAADWRKSSYSHGGANECVEVAPLDVRTGVRDTKDRTRGHLEIAAGPWAAFVTVIKC